MLIIKNANLVNMVDIFYENKDILIDEKVIKEIGTIDESLYPDATIIDAKGELVTPGLIEPHSHVGVSYNAVGPAGNDGGETAHPIMPEVRGIDSVKPHDEFFGKALKLGITSVVTGTGSSVLISGTFCALKTYGKTIFDMVIKEEVCIKMALGENPKGVFAARKQMPMSRMGNAAVLREALMKARIYHDQKKKYEEALANGDTNAKGPEFNMKWESLSRVFDGMLVKIHAHQEDDITTALRIIEEFGLNATIEHCTSGWKIADVLAAKKQKVVIGVIINGKRKIEAKDKSPDSARILYEHGVDFSVMTDHPSLCIENMLLQGGVLVKHGLPHIEMLKALTINAARLNEIDDRVGSIEVGKDADIVIWSGDPFHYMTKPINVIVNGEVVV